MSRIVPSRLYKVKIFESVEYFVREGSGRVRLDSSDDILEKQIDQWIRETKSLVVATGPITVIVTLDVPLRDGAVSGSEPLLAEQERRTVSVIYAPPAEQDEHIYGEQPKTKVRQAAQVVQGAESGGTLSARGISDGRLA